MSAALDVCMLVVCMLVVLAGDGDSDESKTFKILT